MIKKIKRTIDKQGKTEKSALLSMLLKPVNLFLGLLYTPLLLSYLGTEYYGLWATILSVVSWINYFDIGIGNGLRNILATELALDSCKLRKIVSTAYVLLTIIAITILFFLIVCTSFFDWNILFSTDFDMRLLLLINFVFICINFVLALSNSVLYAMQKAELISLRSIYVQAINILGILLLLLFTESNLIYVSILFGTSTMIVYIYNTYVIFNKNPNLIPSVYLFEKCYISSVCNIGVKFFVIQLMCLAMFTVDNIMISHYFGAINVTPFSIVDKVFSTAYSVWAAFLIPYWSGTTTAIAENNIKWIKQSIRKILMLFSFFVVGYVVLGFVFKPLAMFWLHKELCYQQGIVWLMCIFYIFYSILAIECQFINGTGKINTQLYLYIVLGIINVPFSIFFGVYMDMGAFGIRLATTILVFIEIVVLGFNLRNIIRELEFNNMKNS